MGQQQLQFDEYRDFKFCSNSKDKTSEHPAAIYESGKIRKIFLLAHCEPSRTMHLCLSIIAPRLAGPWSHWSLSLSCHKPPEGSRQFTAIIPANLITARMPPYQGHWHHGHQVISNSDCNNAYGALNWANFGITENMLCAADASGNGGSDACQVIMLL